MVTAVVGGLEVLAAGGRPFHRAPQPDGQRGHQHFLGVQVQFRSEPAADIRRHHAQPLFGEGQDLGKHPLDDVRRLGAAVDGHRSGAVVEFGQNRPRLQRARDQVLVPQPPPDDNVGMLLCRRVVACIHRNPEHDVAVLGIGQSRMHQWGVGLCCLPRVGHRGQRLVVDVNRVRRVRGGVGVGGNDGGDAFPLESHHLTASTR